MICKNSEKLNGVRNIVNGVRININIQCTTVWRNNDG